MSADVAPMPSTAALIASTPDFVTGLMIGGRNEHSTPYAPSAMLTWFAASRQASSRSARLSTWPACAASSSGSTSKDTQDSPSGLARSPVVPLSRYRLGTHRHQSSATLWDPLANRADERRLDDLVDRVPVRERAGLAREEHVTGAD